MGFFDGLLGVAKDVIGLVTPGVGSLIGAGMGYMGQQDVNAMNQALFQEQMAFNSAEAEKQREFSQLQQEDVQSFNSAEAARARDWAFSVGNNRIANAVDDARRAGFNPMLGFMQQAQYPGAASASSSPSSGTGASVSGLPHIANAVSSALEGARVGADIVQRQQDYNIKRPAERGAVGIDQAGRALSESLPSAGEALRGAQDAVREAVGEVLDAAADVRTYSAKAADRIEAKVLDAVEWVQGAIANPGKALERVLHSAPEAERYFGSAQELRGVKAMKSVDESTIGEDLQRLRAKFGPDSLEYKRARYSYELWRRERDYPAR